MDVAALLVGRRLVQLRLQVASPGLDPAPPVDHSHAGEHRPGGARPTVTRVSCLGHHDAHAPLRTRSPGPRAPRPRPEVLGCRGPDHGPRTAPGDAGGAPPHHAQAHPGGARAPVQGQARRRGDQLGRRPREPGRPVADTPHGQAGPARVGDGPPALGRLPLHLAQPVRAHGNLHGHHGHAHGDAVDQARHLGGVRIGGAHLVAQRVASRDDRHPRPPRLPVRGGRDALGELRVLRPGQLLGPPSRHRRAGRAGHPHVDAHQARHPLRRLLPGPLLRGLGQARARPLRGSRPPHPGDGRSRKGLAPHDGRPRVLRLPRGPVRPAARRPPARGLGHRAGRGPRHGSRGARRRVGQPGRHDPGPRQRPAPLRPGGGVRCTCGETTIRGFWGGRFKDLLRVQGSRFNVHEVERALRKVDGVSKPSLEYVVVRPSDDNDPLRVRVEVGEASADRDSLASACASAIAEGIGIKATVEVLDREALPRAGFKATRVVEA
ncbi:MAG: hypothetical protein E6G27_13995 [Actinobacteria bacterium]|nr:MAG: hypothetical protein E6G27_13995 [Actinomycetota bacterium]